MKIINIIKALEELAPPVLQEDYDNSGLQIGNPDEDVESCILSLDITEDIIKEAKENKCQLIISHHPLIFKGLKKLTGRTAVERIVNKAIRNGISIYSMHTNLDNVYNGVNGILCEKLGIQKAQPLRKGEGLLRKLVTFCPLRQADEVREAIFKAGAGHIGNYDQCSFNASGLGSFRANQNANPFVGEKDKLHFEEEVRIETIYPVYRETDIMKALLESHPYEEVAYDIYPLHNTFDKTGAGMVGELENSISEKEFLEHIKTVLGIPVIRHSGFLGREVKRIAICGGAGSFLLPDAMSAGADVFLTADLKYHQFFDADGKILLADAGHYETEQFTVELIADYLKKIFPTFALRISERSSNSVNYF